MHLVLQDCPFVRVAEAQMAQVLDIRVEVLDSEIAARYVRGPLADGEPVDMGMCIWESQNLRMTSHRMSLSTASGWLRSCSVTAGGWCRDNGGPLCLQRLARLLRRCCLPDALLVSL